MRPQLHEPRAANRFKAPFGKQCQRHAEMASPKLTASATRAGARSTPRPWNSSFSSVNADHARSAAPAQAARCRRGSASSHHGPPDQCSSISFGNTPIDRTPSFAASSTPASAAIATRRSRTPRSCSECRFPRNPAACAVPLPRCRECRPSALAEAAERQSLSCAKASLRSASAANHPLKYKFPPVPRCVRSRGAADLRAPAFTLQEDSFAAAAEFGVVRNESTPSLRQREPVTIMKYTPRVAAALQAHPTEQRLAGRSGETITSTLTANAPPRPENKPGRIRHRYRGKRPRDQAHEPVIPDEQRSRLTPRCVDPQAAHDQVLGVRRGTSGSTKHPPAERESSGRRGLLTFFSGSSHFISSSPSGRSHRKHLPPSASRRTPLLYSEKNTLPKVSTEADQQRWPDSAAPR